jgi:PAS domain S-box-containing protein
MIALSVRDAGRMLALAAAYAVTATLSLTLGATVHDTPPLWPAAGIAIAALCIGGVRLWPGVALGTLIVFGPRGHGALLTAAIVTSTTLESVVGALLLTRVASFRPRLRRTRDAFALVIAGGIAAPAVGALVGAGAFVLAHALPARSFGGEWLEWFLGDAIGVIVFAPAVLVWTQSQTPRLALRIQVTAVALLAIAVSIAATTHIGPFSRSAADVGTLVQGYVAAIATTALLLAASAAERQDALDRLTESESHLSLVFDSNADTLLLFAVEGEDQYRLVMANRALTDLLGRHRPDAAGRDIRGIPMEAFITDVLKLPADRIPRNLEVFRRAIETKAPFSYENIDWNRADQVSEVTVVPVFDAAGNCTHVLRSSRDISARKQAEESLRLHDFVMTNAPLGVLMVDASHRVVLANDMACTLLGHTRDELLRRPIDALDEPGLADHWKELLELGARSGHQSIEVERVADDGAHQPLELSIAHLAYGGQEMSCVFVRDIAERRRAEITRRTLEAELFHAQKMEAVGTLAGGIAHDFNNILAAIVGNAEMALIELPQGHPARQDIAEVQRAARRARELVQQILTFSRKQSPERRPVRTADVIDDVLRLLRATTPSTIDLRSQILDPALQIFGEPTQLHQVLMNLGTNAAHAIGDHHGVIEIRQTLVDVGRDAIHADLLPGQYVCLTVRDSGHGMDRQTLERVFEPFFTTKDPGVGTGLGLAVVHGIVKSHDGVVLVESAPGHGTTFKLYFPVIAPQTLGDSTPATDVPRGAGERVLFIDDEPALTTVTRRMLERLGYHVVAHASSTEALAAFRADPSAFDLVISDLTMPGMTGAQLALEMRRVRANLPVILSTGYLDRLDAEAARALHARDLLFKPYTTEDLATAVRRALADAAA